jgi:hypothetical protein
MLRGGEDNIGSRLDDRSIASDELESALRR